MFDPLDILFTNGEKVTVNAKKFAKLMRAAQAAAFLLERIQYAEGSDQTWPEIEDLNAALTSINSPN